MKTVAYDEAKLKLVPIEPTEEMILAAALFEHAYVHSVDYRNKIYQAMVAAAPRVSLERPEECRKEIQFWADKAAELAVSRLPQGTQTRIVEATQIYVPVICQNGHRSTASYVWRDNEFVYEGVPRINNCACPKLSLGQGWKADGKPYVFSKPVEAQGTDTQTGETV